MCTQPSYMPPLPPINPGPGEGCTRLKLKSCIKTDIARIPAFILKALNTHEIQAWQTGSLHLTAPQLSSSPRFGKLPCPINQKQRTLGNPNVSGVQEKRN